MVALIISENSVPRGTWQKTKRGYSNMYPLLLMCIRQLVPKAVEAAGIETAISFGAEAYI